MKAARALLILFLTALPALGWAANETALNDRASRTWTILAIDESTGEIRRIKTNAAGAMLVDGTAAGMGAVDQGASGVSDADPWNMMIRSGAGTELGLAASPFAIRIFDGAAAALFTASNKGFVDTELETADLDTGGGTDTQAVVGLRIAESGGSQLVGSANPLPVGGTVLADILTQVTTSQTGAEPFVITIGTTPTLILSADSTRRGATIQNMSNVIIFLGKGAVTTTTGIGFRGGSVANDAKGAVAITDDGDALFGIVFSGTANVRVRPVSE